MVAAQTNAQAQERLMGLFMSLPNGAVSTGIHDRYHG
jgi:hypothetical protein